MFNNSLVRSICLNSNEKEYRISEADFKSIVEANEKYTEDYDNIDLITGDKKISEFFTKKISLSPKETNFANSLELCCGAGFLYFILHARFNFDQTSYFVDISENQCNHFKKRLGENKLADNVLIGDIRKLDFPDGHFEIIYGNSFIHHLPDVGMYLAEVKRLLRDDGRVLLFHEPNVYTSFFQSFPISLYKKTETLSLTDVWLIEPRTFASLVSKIGMNIQIFPSGIFQSILLNPILILLDKINPKYRNHRNVFYLRGILDKLDVLIPRKQRIKYSPSVGYILSKKMDN